MTGTAERPAAAVLLPGFVGPNLPEWLAARLRNGLGGVCLFGSNVESPEQLSRLTAAIRAANPRALIAIDEEGGDVTRLYTAAGSPFPGNALLGRIGDADATEVVGRAVGWELRRVGVNLNFAPDVDINSNPDNPVIGTRSFGTDPETVGAHSAAWTRGLQSTGVAASAKHFPGHGDTAVDSHLALPVVDLPLTALRARELLPFTAAIAAGARTIMTSHILLPQVDANHPATFSATILIDVLRNELGFDGLVVTDALDMKGASGEIGIPAAAVAAIGAGCDLLCIGTDNSDAQLDQIQAALERAVADGELSAERIADAARRVHRLGELLMADFAAIPIPEPGHDALPGIARAIAAFDIRVAPASGARVVTVETAANIAVGESPWGLTAAGLEPQRLEEGDPLPEPGPLVIVGKNNHRFGWVRELVDEARLRHPSTIVVDMGWPSDDRRYADVATFGASRFVGEALAAWLASPETTSGEGASDWHGEETG